ncbi:bromodomain-containing protein DDB_G0280777 [Condylostylus longicornis]|uniref:bromodomain-containing protein DDB_G0280777 n=1 Tax=Condylostylus longicornis TaxID=2530218 RepID=UPI00244E108A|nr:bromodomain-containing protein DDB_G0280777 [Condylostylus longicornis]
MANFAKELNQKLHRLRSDKTSPIRSSSKNSTYQNNNNNNNNNNSNSNNDVLNKRPLFVTTVPSGIFLPPAKDISPTSQKRIYSFSSRPKIFTLYRSNNNYPANYNKIKETIIDDDKAKNSLNERMKRDVFRGSDEIRPYNFYQNNSSMNSSINGSNKALNKKDLKREPAPPQPFKNIMHDKRVIRGSNFSQLQSNPWNPYFTHAGLLSGKDQQLIYTKEQDAKRRLLLRKRCLARNQRNVIGSPPPIQGRVHIPIQTEKYLEELFDRPPEYDANTQTDLFLQRPPSPPYVPAKVGIDRATQIEEGDLFDFDAEAQPILDTLIGHSVQQSLIETLHEQEMAELKAKQEELLARREVELAELRRLEEEDRRLQEEKERRLKQDEMSKDIDVKLQEEVTAAKLLQGHIATILPDVLQKLEPQTDSAHKDELQRKICPWLSKEVAEEVGKIIDSREILTEIIKEIIIQRASVYAGYSESGDDDNIICEEGEEEAETENDYEDYEFIRNELNSLIRNVEDIELIGNDSNKLETIEEEVIIKDENVPLEKEIDDLKELIENNEIENVNKDEPILDDSKIEQIVEDEVMKIILETDLAQTTVDHQETDEIVKGDNNSNNATNDLNDNDDDDNSNTEGIIRNEIDRIISLANSIDETVELPTQIENVNYTTEITRQQDIDDDNTENDIDVDDINTTDNDDNDDGNILDDNNDGDDDGKSDEIFLRNQIEQIISVAEEISLAQNESNNNDGISYIS